MQRCSLHRSLPNIHQSSNLAAVKDARLCRNCLRQGHVARESPSPVRCKISGCGLGHHTDLHPNADTPNETRMPQTEKGSTSIGLNFQSNVSISSCSTNLNTSSTILLALQSYSGAQLEVRALIDPASQGSFISERVAQVM